VRWILHQVAVAARWLRSPQRRGLENRRELPLRNTSCSSFIYSSIKSMGASVGTV
ncbi:unnamed protein product, partial [Musa textilis]